MVLRTIFTSLCDSSNMLPSSCHRLKIQPNQHHITLISSEMGVMQQYGDQGSKRLRGLVLTYHGNRRLSIRSS